MIVKVVTYLDAPGKFSVTDGAELIRDLRSAINKILLTSYPNGFKVVFDNGQKTIVKIISETEAKKRVIGTAGIEQPDPYAGTGLTKEQKDFLQNLQRKKGLSK